MGGWGEGIRHWCVRVFNSDHPWDYSENFLDYRGSPISGVIIMQEPGRDHIQYVFDLPMQSLHIMPPPPGNHFHRPPFFSFFLTQYSPIIILEEGKKEVAIVVY